MVEEIAYHNWSFFGCSLFRNNCLLFGNYCMLLRNNKLLIFTAHMMNLDLFLFAGGPGLFEDHWIISMFSFLIPPSKLRYPHPPIFLHKTAHTAYQYISNTIHLEIYMFYVMKWFFSVLSLRVAIFVAVWKSYNPKKKVSYSKSYLHEKGRIVVVEGWE